MASGGTDHALKWIDIHFYVKTSDVFFFFCYVFPGIRLRVHHAFRAHGIPPSISEDTASNPETEYIQFLARGPSMVAVLSGTR